MKFVVAFVVLLPPLPALRLTAPPVVLPSPNLNANAPLELRLDEPAMKDLSPPSPAEEAPDESGISLPSSPEERETRRL